MSENFYQNKFHELLDNLNAVIHKNGLGRDWGIPMATDEHTFKELLEVTEKFFVENTPDILKQLKLNIENKEEGFHAEAEFQGLAVKAFAASFIGWFRESGGKNFVTVDLVDPDNRFDSYSITMQRHTHPEKTPAHRIAELEGEVSRLKNIIERIKEPSDSQICDLLAWINANAGCRLPVNGYGQEEDEYKPLAGIVREWVKDNFTVDSE
jgi:hypothetical protein